MLQSIDVLDFGHTGTVWRKCMGGGGASGSQYIETPLTQINISTLDRFQHKRSAIEILVNTPHVIICTKKTNKQRL